jgi:hypothetical protein
MSGWLMAREAVMVATPARCATMARVIRPLARLFPLESWSWMKPGDIDSDIIRHPGQK